MAGSNQRTIITNEDDDILDPEANVSGKNRIGIITIIRDGSNYISSMVMVEGSTIRTLTIARNANNYITGISEAIT